MLDPEQAKQYDWFCDMHRAALAISQIRRVRQIVSIDKIVSEFEVSAGAVPFLAQRVPLPGMFNGYSGGLPLQIEGAIVSTADIVGQPAEGDGVELLMDTVEIKGSNIPLLRGLLDNGVKLESRQLGPPGGQPSGLRQPEAAVPHDLPRRPAARLPRPGRQAVRLLEAQRQHQPNGLRRQRSGPGHRKARGGPPNHVSLRGCVERREIWEPGTGGTSLTPETEGGERERETEARVPAVSACALLVRGLVAFLRFLWLSWPWLSLARVRFFFLDSSLFPVPRNARITQHTAHSQPFNLACFSPR